MTDLEYLDAVNDKNAIEETGTETAVNPDGILYITANSSSGSKYYDLTSRMQSYVAGRWQEDIPTYSVVDITDTTFTINTYRTDTNEKIDTQFTIVKETEPEYMSGDISGNGKIDILDAIEICKSIMGMRTFNDDEKAVADYNGDGVVDLRDAIGIAKKLLEK